MISFDNTEIAFSGKKNSDLNRSYWLFKMVSHPRLVNIGKTLTTFAIQFHLPIKAIIKATIFKQFCGGETIAECDETISVLQKYKVGTILDYSVEGKKSEIDFEATTQETIATVEKAKNNSGISFCVFKVTGIARFDILEKYGMKSGLNESEKKDFEIIKNRVNRICKAAFEASVSIFIDAEESWIQQAIDDLTDEMMLLYNRERAIVYNTFQLYRTDRLDFLKQSFEKATVQKYFLGAKLVRGAYMEKERLRAAQKNKISPIQKDKSQTDNDYDAALLFCIKHIDKIAFCAGTHNENSSMHLVKMMEENAIEPANKHIYFSQLFGMSDHISFNLANAGYNVAKYVPYGPVKEVLPYLIRRAQENTSVKGQTGRELGLIMKEKKRREN